MPETQITRGFYTFQYRADDWTHVDAHQRELIAALDGHNGTVHERGMYWAADPGRDRQWMDIWGAHDLDLGGPESWLPVTGEMIRPYERPAGQTDESEEDEGSRLDRIWQTLGELFPLSGDHEAHQQVDLASMRGMAGIILPDLTGAVYSWQTDGVSLKWRTAQGAFIPLQGRASEKLHRWGDNIYTNDHQLDVQLINELLDEYLPGWVVDPDERSIEASVEAAIIIRCVRDSSVPTGESDYLLLGERDAGDERAYERAEWLNSPLCSPEQSYQTDLVGRHAMLVWGNSD